MLLESALVNASTCLSIADDKSDPTNGHCTFPPESFTPNAWCPSIRKAAD